MLITLLAAVVSASSGASACSCLSSFNEVVTKTEVNYSGYVIKLGNERPKKHYQEFKTLLRDKALEANESNCHEVIHLYTSFFADHHLFAFPRKGREPALLQSVRWSESEFESFRSDASSSIEAIGGVWYDKLGTVFVLDKRDTHPGLFVAIRRGEPDDVIAMFEKKPWGYLAHYKHEYWGWQSAEARLRRNGTLLMYGLEGLGRKGSAFLNPGNPLSPFFGKLTSDIYLVSLPSFMPEHRAVVDQIVADHGDELHSAKGIVFDVRGNAGGDAIYFPMAKFILANDIRVSEDTGVLASPLTIEYFESFRNNLGKAGTWLDAPLTRMRKSPGEIVPYLNSAIDGMGKYPENPVPVAVLQDDGVGSAGEAFVFHAKQSRSVVTVGQPTRGNIDYMQVSMSKLGCDNYEYMFGYPLYFRMGVPSDTIDDEGIAPDIRLPEDVDSVSFAVSWLSR